MMLVRFKGRSDLFYLESLYRDSWALRREKRAIHLEHPMDWTVCASNSDIVTLTPSVMVFGHGIFGRSLDLDEVMKVRPLWWDWCLYKKRYQRACSLCLSLLCENSVRRQPWKSQIPYQKLTMLTPWLWTSSLQNCKNINAYCLNHHIVL